MRSLSDDDDDDLWHPSGWSPVFDGVSSIRHLVGFTTLELPVDRFRMSRVLERDLDGAFALTGEARRILAGTFYGFVVVDGDWHDMPDFWPF